MIIDRLERAPLYYGLGGGIARGLRWLAATDLDAISLGRHDIDGFDIWAGVNEYDTKPVEKGLWEAHEKYIDIQYIVRGSERMGWTDIERLHVSKEYDEARDVVFLDGNGDLILVPEGSFVIFFPHDGHMPMIAADSPAQVRKVVVKVAL